MNRIRVEKAACLSGEVTVQGSKNAALPIMAASVLHKGSTILHNCPHITDVYAMEEILRKLGADTAWEGHTLRIDCRHLTGEHIPAAAAEKIRGSVLLAGGLLGRQGSVQMGYPGGCVIGKRPIDLHLEVFSRLGVKIRKEKELYLVGDHMEGMEYTFPRISVGAAENGILAAMRASGTTILKNTAREPEVESLCDFLRAMGADIQWDGMGTVRIEHSHTLHDVTYTIPPDRIAAGTLLLAGAVTRGRIALRKAPVSQMDSLLALYQKMGGQYLVEGGTLITDSRNVCRPLPLLRTEAYPGFPTDLQPLLLVTCCTLAGVSEVEETIFEDRFRILGQLEKMEAKISLNHNRATIRGPVRLKGALISAPDLRAGAALVLAALCAEGETVIDACAYIERGYEDLYGEINLLGGRIRKETDR